jgi:hypothetical protein
MTNTTQSPTNTLSDTEIIARSKIGRHVTYFALTATALLGASAILVAILVPDTDYLDKRFTYVKDVLTIILPLIGTWVGTILAFYFARENFVVAAEQTANLVRQLTPEQKLQSIAVTEVMLNMSASTTIKLTLAAPGDAAKLKLKADVVDAILEKNKRNRLPVVDNAGKVLYVIHRSFIDKFLVKRAEAGGSQLEDATLQDLLSAEDLKSVFQSFVVIGKEAKLIAVKQAMDGNPNCSDAFITEDGTKESKALGWITNVIVQEKSLA